MARLAKNSQGIGGVWGSNYVAVNSSRCLGFYSDSQAALYSINIQGHGGTLIVSNPNFDIHGNKLFKAKYLLSPRKQHLKQAFINFMNKRHKHSDKVIYSEQKGISSNKNSQLYVSFFKLIEAEKKLAESCIFVGNYLVLTEQYF